nr:protein kinase [Kofleriaceae bacterium]
TQPMAEFAKSLERYDVVDRIAIGGMAEVFLAKAYGAHGFEKTLAIKRILPDLASDPEFEERFIAEAKVAVRLSHTNIVQVLDFGRFANSLFIAMEYVDGLDLAALLRRYKERGARIPLSAAFHIAIELARGLDYAHLHGVVHRDVSPSNILLSRAGEVKIADFGIAVAARPGRAPALTGPRKVMGKWRYMSPEQTRGENLDTRSDLFSAAAVMFELFTGDKLFPGDEAEDIMRNIHDMPLPKASARRDGLPAALDDILAQCLARDPTARPARAAIILRALTELSYESSIVATSLDVSEAVASVLGVAPGPAGATALDDLIRKQIVSLDGRDRGRDTAVTDEKRNTAVATNPNAVAFTSTTGALTSPAPADRPEATGVFVHRTDADGLSRLEVDSTTMAAQPRSRRATGQEPALAAGPATGLAGDGERLDPDRRTEVGPPLAESRPFVRLPPELVDDEVVAVPRPGPSPEASSKTPMATVTPAARAPGARGPGARRWWLLGPGALGLIVLVVVLARRGGPAPTTRPAIVASASADAGLSTGTIELVTDPAGAQAFVDGAAVGVTPTHAQVAAGRAVGVRLVLAGHRSYEDTITVRPGQVYALQRQLVVAPARLHVESTPPGATVSLAGAVLGTTPLTRIDLAPGRGTLELERAGYERHREGVELIADGELRRTVELVAVQRTGAIDLHIDDGWADIFLRGKKVGRAPIKGLRLPVGTHRLRLVNPPTGREKTITVEVSADTVRYYRERL